jgi:hypothetical protein
MLPVLKREGKTLQQRRTGSSTLTVFREFWKLWRWKKEENAPSYTSSELYNNMVSPKDSAIERKDRKGTATGHANQCFNYPANVLSRDFTNGRIRKFSKHNPHHAPGSQFPLFASEFLYSSRTCRHNNLFHTYWSGESSQTFNNIFFLALNFLWISISNSSLIAAPHNFFTTIQPSYSIWFQRLTQRNKIFIMLPHSTCTPLHGSPSDIVTKRMSGIV